MPLLLTHAIPMRDSAIFRHQPPLKPKSKRLKNPNFLPSSSMKTLTLTFLTALAFALPLRGRRRGGGGGQPRHRRCARGQRAPSPKRARTAGTDSPPPAVFAVDSAAPPRHCQWAAASPARPHSESSTGEGGRRSPPRESRRRRGRVAESESRRGRLISPGLRSARLGGPLPGHAAMMIESVII